MCIHCAEFAVILVLRILCFVFLFCFMHYPTFSKHLFHLSFLALPPKDIAGHTRVNPNQRQLALQQFVKNVQACPEAMKVLNDWGVRLQAGAVTVSTPGIPSVAPSDSCRPRTLPFLLTLCEVAPEKGLSNWGL